MQYIAPGDSEQIEKIENFGACQYIGLPIESISVAASVWQPGQKNGHAARKGEQTKPRGQNNMKGRTTMSQASFLPDVTDNRQTAPAATQPEVDLLALQAAFFKFAASVADEHFERDDLNDGQAANVKLSLIGEVDGRPYSASYAGSLAVGHSSTRASSVGPSQDELLAVILGKLNTATREKLVRDLADEYAKDGKFKVAAEFVTAAKKLRGDLRQKVTQEVRGSVRVESRPDSAAGLKVTG